MLDPSIHSGIGAVGSIGGRLVVWWFWRHLERIAWFFLVCRHDICQIFYTSAFPANMKVYPNNAQTTTCFTPEDAIFNPNKCEIHLLSSMIRCALSLLYKLIKNYTKIFKITQDMSSPAEILPNVEIIYTSAACDACDKHHVCRMILDQIIWRVRIKGLQKIINRQLIQPLRY